MIFGAADALSTFSFLVRQVLKGIDCCFNYLDDLTVITVGWQHTIDTLSIIFQRFLDYGLTLGPEK